MTVKKIYFPDDPSIQIHQSRVQRCPKMFPQGFYWSVIDVLAAVIPSEDHMIVTDDSNGGESNCKNILDTSDSISVLKQQVTNP